MIKFNFDPLTIKKFRRFRGIKRGYYSLLIMLFLLFAALFAELWINSRPLMVKFEGQYYYPTYGAMIPGTAFGLDYPSETKYRELAKKFAGQSENWVIMPLVPYNAVETHSIEGEYPPYPPNAGLHHYLGTDTIGRDIVARLVYGFRICIFFSLLVLIFSYAIGIVMGCAMGFFGGTFDMIMQRVIEIWSNIPVLYIIIVIASIVTPNFSIMVGLAVIFGWHPITYYMRAVTYKEKAREYVQAARSLGASPMRIILKQIMPNTLSVVVTFAPFAIAGGITMITALDYLGFGLPAPTPSWGELLSQGQKNLDDYWIVWSVIVFMISVLVMVTFIGEAVREAFDPKKFTVYK